MNDLASILPHVNATLNAIAATLLVVGRIQIARGHENTHRRIMLIAFGVSIAFLISYLTRRALTGEVKFPSYAPTPVRYGYYALLISHVTLAATIPFLASTTIYFGLRDRRAAHRRLARITFPLWLYVSVTGVVVYFMLYQLYPPHG